MANEQYPTNSGSEKLPAAPDVGPSRMWWLTEVPTSAPARFFEQKAREIDQPPHHEIQPDTLLGKLRETAQAWSDSYPNNITQSNVDTMTGIFADMIIDAARERGDIPTITD